MFKRFAALLLVLLASVPTASAQESGVVGDAVEIEARPQPANYWVPALEIFGQHLTFNLVARAADKDYAKISPSTMWTNLTGPWEVDEDAFMTNQIGHPYQGALYMTAARSSGIGFWGSALYTTLGSLAWEYLWETEKPSANDQLTTSFSGIMLGEVMHRIAVAILYDEAHSSSLVRRLGAFVVDPMGSFNREVIWPHSPVPDTPSFFATGRLGYGVFRTEEVENESSTPQVLRQVHLGVDATYGRPSEPEFIAQKPLDHFDITAEVDLAEQSVAGSLYMRGLLAGSNHRAGPITGMYGLYAAHDFFTPDGLRVGAFSLGLGSTLEVDLGGKWFAQSTAVSGVVPIGAMGRRETTGLRNYQLGPGLSQVAELRVGRMDLGVVELTSRNVSIDLPLEGPARAVSQNTLRGTVLVWGRHALGTEFASMVSTRWDGSDAFTETHSGYSVRVFISFVSDTGLGSARRR